MDAKFIVIIAAICSLFTYYVTDKVWQSTWDSHLLDDAKSLIAADERLREREALIIKKQTKVENDAKETQNKYLADLASANAAAERLRVQLQQFASRAPANSTGTVEQRAAAATNQLVLTKLLERARIRMVELADYADRSRNAGLICEEKYNAIVIL